KQPCLRNGRSPCTDLAEVRSSATLLELFKDRSGHAPSPPGCVTSRPIPAAEDPMRFTGLRGTAARLAFLVVAASLIGTPLWGQEGGERRPGLEGAPSNLRQTEPHTGPAYSGADHNAAPRARAVRTTERITVDGRLDEPAWMTAPAITNFSQTDPVEGAPVSQP